jgi:hypothetical protein
MTSPLSPEQRAAVLARHPGSAEADLDALESLVQQRVKLEVAPPELWGDVETGGARREAALADLDARIAELHDLRFPEFEAAIEEVALRHDDEPEDIA